MEDLNAFYTSVIRSTLAQQNREFLPRKKFLQNSYFKQYFA